MGGDFTAPGVLYAAGRSSGVDTTFVIGDPRFDEIRLSESPENTLSRARWQQFQAASSSSNALRQQAGSAYRAAIASRSTRDRARLNSITPNRFTCCQATGEMPAIAAIASRSPAARFCSYTRDNSAVLYSMVSAGQEGSGGQPKCRS